MGVFNFVKMSVFPLSHASLCFFFFLEKKTCASKACKHFAIFLKGIFGIFYIQKVPYKRKQYVIKGKLDLYR